MFEHLYFKKTLKNQSLTDVELFNSPQKALNKLTEVDKAALSNTNFKIHGSVSILPEIPTQETIKNNFMYIQSFSYMKMNEFYYTHRANYNSVLILYTYAGNGELKYMNKTYTLTAGSLFIIDCKYEHKYYTVGNYWEHGDLHINGNTLQFILDDYFSKHSPVFVIGSQKIFQQKLEQLLFSYSNMTLHRSYAVHSKINELLLFILTDSNEKNNTNNMPETITCLIQYLEHNFEKQLLLDDMAKFCSLSKYHLLREFKKYTGFTPHDYINELRINNAKTLLMTTNIPSYKIGCLVGIPNETNFIRLFKLKSGMTPRAYREKI